MTKNTNKVSRGENIANQIVNHYYDGMNAGSDFVADVIEDFSNLLNELYESIDVLKERNKKLRKKMKTLHDHTSCAIGD